MDREGVEEHAAGAVFAKQVGIQNGDSSPLS
jgi:hypothetical protein